MGGSEVAETPAALTRSSCWSARGCCSWMRHPWKTCESDGWCWARRCVFKPALMGPAANWERWGAGWRAAWPPRCRDGPPWKDNPQSSSWNPPAFASQNRLISEDEEAEVAGGMLHPSLGSRAQPAPRVPGLHPAAQVLWPDMTVVHQARGYGGPRAPEAHSPVPRTPGCTASL